ncbi:stalk domain-containing protein [Bacillus sp. Marseille-P3661]|uniref:stalk domain-containing protein n=1 Tax=Bacillus sp. Marseille-P3661 TaxID=1936234 RepID=UPI000C851468|nr:stalk domain-containing protein [Bacillus sp. Marseille-P3661]
MNKKLISSVVAASMLVLPSLNVVQAANSPYQPVNLKIDGVEKNFAQPPVLFHDVTLVPLRGIFESLGVEVKWDPELRKVTAIRDQEVLELKIGSKEALKNYKPIPLMQPAMIINDSTMVPLRFVSESFGANVDWDGSTKTVIVESVDEDSEESVSEEVENALPELTVAAAVEKALTTSNDIRTADANVERAEEVQGKAADNVTYAPIGTGNGAADALARRAFTGLQQANIGERVATKQLDVAKESVAFSVQIAYNEILRAQAQLSLAEKALELAGVQRNIVEQQAKVGIVSEFDLTKENNSYDEKEKQLQSAQTALKDEYEKFNLLVGYSLDKRFNLVDQPDEEIMIEEDVDYQVAKVLSGSTSVWLAEQEVNIAKLNLDLYVFNDPTNPDTYKATEIDVEKAEYSLSDTKKQLEQGVRETYNSIKQLQNQLSILETNLNNAEQTQRLVKARHDLGMATTLELMNANMGVDQIKQQMFDIKAQLDYLQVSYEKPWVAAGR